MASGDKLGALMQSDIGIDVPHQAVEPSIAPLFDATATYAAGDMCTKGGVLYIFANAHTGAWDAADVTAVNAATYLKMVAKGVTPLVGRGVNLLDNWYFVGGGSQQGGGQFPINQRGQTSYTGAGYGIDRWRLIYDGNTLRINDGYIEVSRTNDSIWVLWTKFENALSGQRITASVLTTNGLYTHTWQSAFDGTSSDNGEVGVWLATEGVMMIGLIQPMVRIKAVKLELGDTQTLAHQDENGSWVLNDPPPDYGMELFKCQTSTADSTDTYANYIPQMVHKDTTDPDCTYRVLANGVFEWVNPPLEANVEYRTTERFLGKPVYQKVCVFSDIGPVGEHQVLVASNTDYLVSAHAVVSSSDTRGQILNDHNVMPAHGSIPWYFCTFIASGGSLLATIKTETAILVASAYAIIKYTKNTD